MMRVIQSSDREMRGHSPLQLSEGTVGAPNDAGIE